LTPEEALLPSEYLATTTITQKEEENMAASTKNGAKPAKTGKGGVPETFQTITGKLQRWQYPGSKKVREWVNVDMTVGSAREVLGVRRFDPMRGAGVQREASKGHVDKLAKAVENDEYTPTPLQAFIRQEHLDSGAVVRHKDGTVEIRVSSLQPLDTTDGQHRTEALSKVRGNFHTRPEDQKLIDELPLPVQIFLNPEDAARSFCDTQAGIRVSRNLVNSLMKLSAVDASDESRLTRQVAVILNGKADGFLQGHINFGVGDGKVNSSSIETATPSDLGNSLYLGSLIALSEQTRTFKGKDHKFISKWLADAYEKMYRGVGEYGQKTVEADEEPNADAMPDLFMPGKLLLPTSKGGTSGGSQLLIGMGNVLIARTIICGRKEIDPTDVQLLVGIADEMFSIDGKGNYTASHKREFIRQFTVRAFAGLDVEMKNEVPLKLETWAETGTPWKPKG
jgi:hypothetical protein